MLKPKVLILRAAGTNCDQETAFAFESAESQADLVHINQLVNREKDLRDYQILVIPGGFTYGDDIAAGKILANELRHKLLDDIKKFVEAGKLILGICNGFQILVKAGFLPGNADSRQEASLIINDSRTFEDRWVYLKSPQSTMSISPQIKSIWTRNLPEIIYLPVAHGEGKFITQDISVLERLKVNSQIVFQYCNEKGNLSGFPFNPNGSQENIAGICDERGTILGLMPHPERHIDILQHPRRHLEKNKREGDGFAIIRNGVEYAKKFL